MNVKDVKLVNALDKETRWSASSGGVCRIIGYAVLNNGLADVVYTLTRTDAVPFCEGGFLSEPKDVLQTVNSQYQPVLAYANFRPAKATLYNSMVLIGLPCQVKAARKLLSLVHPSCNVFSVALLCKQQKKTYFTRFIQRQLGIGQDERIEYRGHGWPGHISAAGKEVEFQLDTIVFGKGLWTIEGCKFCGDCLASEVADLTLADPWNIVTPRSANGGMNLVFVWSRKGEQLLETAGRLLEGRKIAIDEAITSIDYEAFRRKQNRMKCHTQDFDSVAHKVRYYVGEKQRHLYEKLLDAWVPPCSILRLINKVPYLG